MEEIKKTDIEALLPGVLTTNHPAFGLMVGATAVVANDVISAVTVHGGVIAVDIDPGALSNGTYRVSQSDHIGTYLILPFDGPTTVREAIKTAVIECRKRTYVTPAFASWLNSTTDAPLYNKVYEFSAAMGGPIKFEHVELINCPVVSVMIGGGYCALEFKHFNYIFKTEGGQQ